MNEQNANPQVPAVEPDETVEEATAEETQEKTIEEQAAEGRSTRQRFGR